MKTRTNSPAPCGTYTARRRHRRRGETCATCGNGKELQPCGTYGAYRRHRKAGEDACGPCHAAFLEYDRERRAGRGAVAAKPFLPSPVLIEEIRFLLNAGEGQQRIVTAMGYEGRAGVLRDRLYKLGEANLAQSIFAPWELAA